MISKIGRGQKTILATFGLDMNVANLRPLAQLFRKEGKTDVFPDHPEGRFSPHGFNDVGEPTEQREKNAQTSWAGPFTS